VKPAALGQLKQVRGITAWSADAHARAPSPDQRGLAQMARISGPLDSPRL